MLIILSLHWQLYTIATEIKSMEKQPWKIYKTDVLNVASSPGGSYGSPDEGLTVDVRMESDMGPP